VRKRTQAPDFQTRKRPSQQRSRATFDAIVEACTWLLPRLGFAGTTTNHVAERAGVNVASLYEYFPGKDAIVAEVAERLVGRVLRRLEARGAEILDERGGDALRLWIDLIHETVAHERELVRVFVYEVPYTNQLEAVRAISPRLLELSESMRRHAGGRVRRDLAPATLHLVVNLVSSTIMQVVLEPPAGVTPRALLDELCRRIEPWLRQPARSARPPGDQGRARSGR
jgi:AcrR family transcriptional regulator